MVYLKDIVAKFIHVTTDREEAAHFYYQDQSSVSEIDIITELLSIHTGHIWDDMIDEEDEDRRHIIFKK